MHSVKCAGVNVHISDTRSTLTAVSCILSQKKVKILKTSSPNKQQHSNKWHEEEQLTA